MSDELVRTTDALMQPDLVTLERVARFLHDTFGPLVDADYLDGKTQLRDAVSSHFEISDLVAEDLCDELERADRVHFVRTAEGAAWHIHAEPERA